MNGTSLERERKIRSISFVCSANERTSENWKRKSIASTTTRGKTSNCERRTNEILSWTNGMRTLTKIKIGQNRTFGHNSDKYFFSDKIWNFVRNRTRLATLLKTNPGQTIVNNRRYFQWWKLYHPGIAQRLTINHKKSLQIDHYQT